jgi:hypothetical protein
MTIRVKQLGNGEFEIQLMPVKPAVVEPQQPPRKKPVSRGTEIRPGVFI